MKEFIERIRLIHWKIEEAEDRAASLREMSYEVTCEPFSPKILRDLREHPPAAVVIDLTRLPAQGRDVGIAVRHYKTTRHVPIVFVDGEPEKVARIREHIPDAVYTTWSEIQNAIKQAIAHPPKDPVAPKSLLEGYSGTPLLKKLGIKSHSTIALIDPPDDFETTLGELPEDVKIIRGFGGQCDLTIWFNQSREELQRRIREIAEQIGKDGLWIVWPKKASQTASDLSQTVVRKTGLASDLVDYKVCSVNETWAGLKFTKRKSK